MPSHGQVAKSVREHREKHPELYCSKCLWRTGGGDCERHSGAGQPWLWTHDGHDVGDPNWESHRVE